MARVLLVEDDVDIQATVRELLEDDGHIVAVANNGVEAMATLERMAPPSLILLDLIMPQMDGWRVLETLRADERWSSIPIIVTSATPDATARAKASAIIRKPYVLEKLLNTVNDIARTSSVDARATG